MQHWQQLNTIPFMMQDIHISSIISETYFVKYESAGHMKLWQNWPGHRHGCISSSSAVSANIAYFKHCSEVGKNQSLAPPGKLWIPLWPSGMFTAIGTRGRGLELQPELAVPQKLPLEWPISAWSGRAHPVWPVRLSRVVKLTMHDMQCLQ